MITAPMIRVETDENGEPTEKGIKKAFDTWQKYQERYITLENYYIGNQAIQNKQDGARICGNMCKYIADTITGYMTGNPITYACDETDGNASIIVDLLNRQDSSQVDAEIIKTMSIYGRAFRLVYHADDEDLTPKSTVFTPREAFVAYTGTTEPDSVFGAVVYPTMDDNGTMTYMMDLYTRHDVQRWECKGLDETWQRTGEPRIHRFGRVPLIEYKNDVKYLSDIEGIISLQDAYNQIMSDRQDDKDAFADAMLLLSGFALGVDAEEINEGKDKLKKQRVLQMADGNMTAQWLTKTLNEADVQVLADALVSDMHKFARVPNLSDEQFSQNASGVAMQFKLFGTDILAGNKARNFQKGQTRLFKLYDAALHNATASLDYTSSIDFTTMRCIFRFSIPTDMNYEAQSLATYKAAGIVSDETLMEHCSLVENIQIEKERLAEQNKATLDHERALYADEFASMTKDEEE